MAEAAIGRAPAAEPSVARPFVSLVVLCRNERHYIGPCLDSLLAGDYDADRIEFLVADGMSDDGTRDVVAEYVRRDPRVRLIDNPRQITPAAFNAGIRAAQGDVIMPIGAHCRYAPTYVSRLVGWLERSGADNVGGVCRTVPSGTGARARGIAAALSHPLAVGNAHFRIGVREPRWVDTVPFGCYRRDVFTRIGMFDEELVRNQDDEFNHRLLSHGGRILLVPDVVTDYYARDSFARLWRMYYQYGYYKPLVGRKLGRVLTGRQLVPPLFAASLIVGFALAPFVGWMAWALAAGALVYALTVGAVAVRVAQGVGPLGALAFAVAVPVVHLGYGIGFLRGLADFVVRRRSGPEVSTVAMSR